MDFPLRKPAPLDTSASKGDTKPKDIIYTHRQELEVMAERGVQTAIDRLQPIAPRSVPLRVASLLAYSGVLQQ